MQLPPVLDLAAARPLHAQILSARGAALELDASGVERVGAVCLQVLLAAHAQWIRDGQRFKVTAASPAFEEAMRLASVREFNVEGAQS